MPRVISVCEAVTGHVDLVPCRLCTGYVPRSQLEGGLLPEETHHDAETLLNFFAQEKQRRDDIQRELTRELQDLRKEATAAGAWAANLGTTKKRRIQKKPAAADKNRKRNVMKKPAAGKGRGRGRASSVLKRPTSTSESA